MVGSLDKINNVGRYEYDDMSYQLFKEALAKRNDDPEICVEYDDRSIEAFSMNEMMDYVDKGHISFYGWRCNAGIDRFYVHCDNYIWCCQEEFENGFQPIAHLDKADCHVFKHQPMICKCEACICEGFVKKNAN